MIIITIEAIRAETNMPKIRPIANLIVFIKAVYQKKERPWIK